MKKDDYTNRELDVSFKTIIESLERIEKQTTLTNGRVSNLERWRESVIGKVLGAGAVIAFIWTIIWAIFLKQL